MKDKNIVTTNLFTYIPTNCLEVVESRDHLIVDAILLHASQTSLREGEYGVAILLHPTWGKGEGGIRLATFCRVDVHRFNISLPGMQTRLLSSTDRRLVAFSFFSEKAVCVIGGEGERKRFE